MKNQAETLALDMLELDVSNLRDFELQDAFNQLVERANELDDRSRFLGAIFTFLEKWPETDVGSPGPLVHYAESCCPGSYETLLLDSLERYPVPMTIWMANRLLNAADLDKDQRARLVGAFEASVTHRRSSASVRAEAQRFLMRHNSGRSLE